jgi:hypothetical protein
MTKAKRVRSTPRAGSSKRKSNEQISKAEREEVKARHDAHGQLWLKAEPLLCDVCRQAEIVFDAVSDGKEYSLLAVDQLFDMARDLREVFYGRPPFAKQIP